MIAICISIALIVCFLVYYNYKFKDIKLKEESCKWKLDEAERLVNEAESMREEANKDMTEASQAKALAEQENIEAKRNNEEAQLKKAEAEKKYNEVLAKYKEEYDKLSSFMADQRAIRQTELDEDMERQRLVANNELNSYKESLTAQMLELEEERENYKLQIKNERERLDKDLENQQQKFDSLIEPLKKYEMDKQERLFYTIQVPDEYKEDINFLITTVSQKVQHPDIINKLVWAEYVKPYLDETIKRAGIEDKPGIYKITNINDGKCYVGKSTNLKKRLQDHFKASLHLGTAAHQMVHDAIWRDGFWNWTIEPIIYCDKDKLSEMEKYYIDFFKAQEFGYNKNQGG